LNVVARETPVAEVAEFVRRDGYVVMRDALTAAQLDEITEAYDRQLALHPREPGAIRLELPRLIELDPAFEQLMDNPPVFAVVRELLGPTLELGTGGELDCKFGPTPAYIAWHADFQFLGIPYPRQFGWVRCVYLIGDVTTDMGPFTLVPGSHGRGGAELARYIGAPYKVAEHWGAGISPQAGFLRFEWSGEDAYPLVREKMSDPETYEQDIVRFEMMRYFGHFLTESRRTTPSTSPTSAAVLNWSNASATGPGRVPP